MGENKSLSFAVLILLLVFVLISRLVMRDVSLTADEAKHYRYGQNILQGNSNRFDDSKMPISAVNAFPRRLSFTLSDQLFRDTLANFQTARMMTVVFSALTAVTVYLWSKSLFGSFGGLMSLVLYVFDPNIIAHSGLVTTDIFATGMFLLSTYFFWRFLNHRSVGNLLIVSVMVGISQLVKYTSIVLYPFFAIHTLIFFIPEIKSLLNHRRKAAFFPGVRQILFHSIVFLSINLLIINAGFLFNRTFEPLNAYEFRSSLFQVVQASLGSMESIRIPTAYPYLEGLDWVLFRERTGGGYGNIYLLGNLRNGSGFPGYYLIASLLKLPITTIIFIGFSLLLLLKRRKELNFTKDLQFVIIPTVFLSVYFNFFFRAQIGIRFYLVLFPFLFVLCGILLQEWQRSKPQYKGLIIVLLLYMLGSVFSYYPHFLPYLNEIVWDRKDAYRYLADSNIDWEQGRIHLKNYLDQNPEARFEPPGVVSGTIVISVNALVGVTTPVEKYAWIRENFEPADTIAYEYLVFEVGREQLEDIFNP